MSTDNQTNDYKLPFETLLMMQSVQTKIFNYCSKNCMNIETPKLSDNEETCFRNCFDVYHFALASQSHKN